MPRSRALSAPNAFKSEDARIATIRILGALFLWVGLAAQAFGQAAIEQRKIEYLIGAIADLGDATFIRNGSEYSARQAVDHLHAKLQHAGNRIVTAEDFIVYCATGSSLSGEKYRIKFADGRMVDSAEFLRGKLAVFGNPAPRPANLG